MTRWYLRNGAPHETILGAFSGPHASAPVSVTLIKETETGKEANEVPIETVRQFLRELARLLHWLVAHKIDRIPNALNNLSTDREDPTRVNELYDILNAVRTAHHVALLAALASMSNGLVIDYLDEALGAVEPGDPYFGMRDGPLHELMNTRAHELFWAKRS